MYGDDKLNGLVEKILAGQPVDRVGGGAYRVAPRDS